MEEETVGFRIKLCNKQTTNTSIPVNLLMALLGSSHVTLPVILGKSASPRSDVTSMLWKHRGTCSNQNSAVIYPHDSILTCRIFKLVSPSRLFVST